MTITPATHVHEADMSEATRSYTCRIILRTGKQSVPYTVKTTAAGWTMSRARKSYELWQDPSSREILCSCPGHRYYRHCKHADWLSVIGVGMRLAEREAYLKAEGDRMILEGRLARHAEAALAREQQLQERIRALSDELERTVHAYDDLRERAYGLPPPETILEVPSGPLLKRLRRKVESHYRRSYPSRNAVHNATEAPF